MRHPRWTEAPLAAVLLGGLLVAVLDMGMAMGFWALKGVAPTRILQGIASGWLGREAAVVHGDAWTAWLGAVSHYAIATAMVACYWYASRWLPRLTEQPLRYGLAYGVATWAVMKFVVLPLSAVTPGDPPLSWQLCHFASHLFIVGVLSALLARRLRAASASAP